jgi:hypothetical protein
MRCRLLQSAPKESIEELSVNAIVTEQGLKGSVRSRAAVALDRLVGNALGVPSAYLERVVGRIEARSAVERDLIEKEGHAALAKIESVKELGSRVVDRFLEKEGRRQANQEAVATEALEVLKQLPPPDAADDSKVINEDWLNIFSAHAENASSERLRSMWARVLAGEIRKPGAFSLATLRFISELDQYAATSFEEVIKTRTKDGFIPRPPKIEGDKLLQLTFLEEIGLLQDINGFIEKKFSMGDDGYVYYFDSALEPGLIFLRTKQVIMRLRLIKITRVGTEILSILSENDKIVSLKAIADQVEDESDSVIIGKVVSVDASGRFKFIIIENIK